MPLLQDLPLDNMTPSQLWPELDTDTRLLAARSLLDPAAADPSGRAEAHAAIASALRYRPAAVLRLPAGKRAEYLVRAVRPDESLATSLLLVLHLTHRKEMLAIFLETLGIPQQDGLIESDHELVPLAPERLGTAVDQLRESFPEDQVDIYLASLIAMDSDVWGGLIEVVRRRRD